MKIEEYLMDELKRLNRINDKLEKDINTKAIPIKNEPEQIVNNVKAMCEIANSIQMLTLYNKKETPVDETSEVIINNYIDGEKISSTVEPLKNCSFIDKISKSLTRKE